MKVAIPCNSRKELVSLDKAESIIIYDDSDGSIRESENPGFGSKEATMSIILRQEPDVIAVKGGVLCPGSYMMSLGIIKYAIVNSENADDIIKNKEYKNAKTELPEELFAENE